MDHSTDKKPATNFLGHGSKFLWFRLAPLLIAGAAIFFFITMQSTDTMMAGESPKAYERFDVRVKDVTIHVSTPLTQAASQKGLAGRDALADTEGMLWNFPEPIRPTFWMKGMRISLDFIWVADDRVAEITTDVPPPSEALDIPTYRPATPVSRVLEVRAGFAAAHGITVGDPVRLLP